MRKTAVKELHSFGSGGTYQPHDLNVARESVFDNKKITINITDITEGNAEAKFRELEKCLSGKNPVYIPADNTKRLPNVHIRLKDYSQERIEKALRTMAFSFGILQKSAKGEVFLYSAQEKLTDKWCAFFSQFVKNTYEFVIDYFKLPQKKQCCQNRMMF